MDGRLERAVVVVLQEIDGDYFTWNVKTGERVTIPQALFKTYNWVFPLADGRP